MLEEAGLASVADVLAAMHESYGDPAFSPPPLLTDFARAGLPLDRAGQRARHLTAQYQIARA
jgi:hypothetical protein